MNRHSKLFRVAFLSLVLAVSLPLMIFIASQVRHRQLKSTANPRWAQFNAVNGSKARAIELPHGSNGRQSAKPGSAAAKKPAPSPEIVSHQPPGMTGSASGRVRTGIAPNPIALVPDPVPLEISVERTPQRRTVTKEPQSIPGTLSQQQTTVLQPAAPRSMPVGSVPDDSPAPELNGPRIPTRTAAMPKVEFRTLEDTKSVNSLANSGLEARLAGLQRRLDQLAQVQADNKLSDLERALSILQQVQDSKNQQNQAINDLLNSRQSDPPIPTPPQPQQPRYPAAAQPAVPPPPAPSPGIAGDSSRAREPSIKILQGDAGDNDERFSIQVQDANLTEVLEMLAQLSGVNILPSREVQGRVSLNLQDVTVDRALDAILRSQGFVHEREGDFIYVRSLAEDSAIRMANRKLITKVYQLNYVNVGEVQKLIDPVLTKGIGRHAVTSPAQSGIGPTQTSAGGDSFSNRDTLLVQDYPEVIAEVDKVIIEIDVPPLQVMIEAKILSVSLSDSMQFGVNFAMLNGAQNSQLLSGNGSTLNGAVGFPATPSLVPAAGDFVANTAGLKYGFIQGDVSGFIKALEQIADTTLIAAPELRVLNKQKAELIIGQRLSYKTLAFNGTQTVENVQFLDAGTKLLIRPFIAADGLVRLEVHPERSKAVINESTGLPNSETTEVTTNVMVRDGTTVVLGGLISEESIESIDRVPFLGAIPWVGAAFRNKTEQVSRNEMIVLITPRIVTEPEAAIEGEKLQFETESRAAYFRDSLSPVNRTNLTRAHYERACIYFDQGNLLKAKQQIDAALLQNKGDLECQKLKLKIDHALREQQSRVWRWPRAANRSQTLSSR